MDAGLDIHKESVQITVVNDASRLLFRNEQIELSLTPAFLHDVRVRKNLVGMHDLDVFALA